MIRTLCTLGAALLCLFACTGSEDATKGGYSDLCGSPDGCDDGFECVAGMCTSRCTSEAECKKNSDRSVCASNSYCYEPCMDRSECMRINGALVCNQVVSTQGTCRAQ